MYMQLEALILINKNSIPVCLRSKLTLLFDRLHFMFKLKI